LDIKKIEGSQKRLDNVLFISLESIRIIALLLLPVMPATMNNLLSFLDIKESERGLNNIKFGKTASRKFVGTRPDLFRKVL